MGKNELVNLLINFLKSLMDMYMLTSDTVLNLELSFPLQNM